VSDVVVFSVDPYQILGPTSSRLANPGERVKAFLDSVLTSQVRFIYIALFTIHIVSKHLDVNIYMFRIS